MRWLVVVLACLFIVAQFSRPARTNPAIDQSLALHSRVQVSKLSTEDVKTLCDWTNAKRARIAAR
jgi:hypothetical protein